MKGIYLEKPYQDMQLRGYSEHTRAVYRRAVRKFLNYSRNPIEALDEHDVRDYVRYGYRILTRSRCGYSFAAARETMNCWDTIV